MKYLRRFYESHTNVIFDMEDILLDIKDQFMDKYDVSVNMHVYTCEVKITKNLEDVFGHVHITKKDLVEISDVIVRLYDYMKNNQSEFTRVPECAYVDNVHYTSSNRLVGWAQLDRRYSKFDWVFDYSSFDTIKIKFRKK